MKILFLADWYLPHAGGSRVYYHNILKSLVAQFPDQVTVLTKKVPGWEEFDGRESTDSLRILRRFHPLPDWKVHRYPTAISDLARALSVVGYQQTDLVLVGDLFPQGVVGFWLKQLVHKPYVMFAHGDEITQTDQRRYQPILRDRIYRSADVMVAANEFTRQKLIRIGLSGSRLSKILPGADCSRFFPQPRDEKLVKEFDLEGKFVLLTTGRIIPRKGQAIVIQAVAKLVSDHPQLRYLIAGEGPERPNLERMAKELGLANVVRFVGDVSNENLAAFYNLCDAFVLANRQMADGDIETFGMVFVEANATGKPVIGGRSGGTAEAVLDGVTGLLVNTENGDEIATALKLLIENDSLRYKLGSAGLRRARAEFDWADRARDLRKIIAAVVERSRSGGTPPLGANRFQRADCRD